MNSFLKSTLGFLFFSFLFPLLDASQIYFGPEIYSLKRWRESGACQRGRMDGLKVGFDRIERYGWYFGGDYLWAEGTIRGSKSNGQPLASAMRDKIWEIRAGYTLQKDCNTAFFTPFIGYGSFNESNHFIPPTLVSYTTYDTFKYVSLGFLSGYHPLTYLCAGFNFKAEFMSDGKSKVTGLSDTDCTLQMAKSIQFRAELPLELFSQPCLSAQIVPFYEFRHFGGREDYPHSFLDTKFQIFGMRLAAMYLF